MKTLLLAIIALVSINSFAASNCEKTATKAAISAEFPKGLKEGFSFDIDAQLSQKTGSILVYSIEILPSYSDGASTDEFPSTVYSVTTSGSEAACKVVSVKVSQSDSTRSTDACYYTGKYSRTACEALGGM